MSCSIRGPLFVLITSLMVSACALSHRGLSDAAVDRGPVTGDAIDSMRDATDAEGADGGDAADGADVADGADGSACEAGVLCGATCVDTATDVHHCGGCGTDCTALPNVVASAVQCVAGACELTSSCSANHANCDADVSNGCEADLTLAANCGACGVVCGPTAPMCGSSGGAFTCMTGCVPPRADRCGTACVDLTTDAANCGTCRTVCAGGPNSTPMCTLHTCTLVCDANFANCDGVAANGCEVDLRSSAQNCAACGFACPTGAHATPTCTARSCGLACATGFGDCDTLPGNGCEADLGTDPAHCGTCAISCPGRTGATRTCVAGACSYDCNAGTADCDGMAANGCETTLASDPAHCGVCATACPVPANGMATCTASVCGVACNAGYVLSGGSCVPAASDACPVSAFPLADGATVVLTGTTAGRTHDATSSCVGGSTPDVAYTLLPAVSGSLTITLSALYDAVFFVRPVCNATAGELNCTRAGVGVSSATVAVTAGTAVTVWVDGNAGATGAYALVVELNTRCGDHVLETGEGCDDGNRTAGDGCSASCAVDVPSTDGCPGISMASISLANGPVWLRGTTAGATADLAPSCAGTSGVDIVYTVVPTVSGTLRITVYPTTRWDPQIYVRGTCAGPTDLACQNGNPSDWPESVSVTVTAGTTYYVIVDGATGSSGPFQLLLEIPRCGDRWLQSGETCDDGNAIAGDGCDASCQVEPRCAVAESEPNVATLPQMITLACPVFDVTAAITPLADQDFFAVPLRAGQVVDARVFVGSVLPGSRSADTILEVYRGPLVAAPGNWDCGGSNALVCHDDLIWPSHLLSGFTFPVPADGTYVFRVLDYRNSATVANYGLQLRTR